MKNVAYIFFIVFLSFNLSNCKTVESKNDKKDNIPKVEFTDYEFGKSNFPEPKGQVNDFELVFNLEELEKLTRLIRDFEKNTSNQIAIATIKTIKEYDDFDKYALDLSNYWGVGQKNKDNGLTIVFSKNLRKIRISTGTGTGKILTDEICNKILEQIILPEFKKGNYFDGIEKGLSELIAKWE